MTDANGCVIVARDGKALGAFPSSGVTLLEPMGMQLARLPGIKRAALEFSGSMWAFLGRPLYAVVATGSAPADPSDFLGRFEEAVLAAENSDAAPARSKVVVPDLVAAGASAKTPGSSSPGAETDADEEDPLAMAQEFSNMFQEEFGDTPETDAADAADAGPA